MNRIENFATLDILTSLGGNYLQAFLSFKNALLRHHVTNFEKIFDTIQDFLISLIKIRARSVAAILRYQASGVHKYLQEGKNIVRHPERRSLTLLGTVSFSSFGSGSFGFR